MDLESKFEGIDGKFNALSVDLSAGFGGIKQDNAHLKSMFESLQEKFGGLEAAIEKMAEQQVAVPEASTFEFMDIKENVSNVKQSLMQNEESDDAKSDPGAKLEAQITSLEAKIDNLQLELAPLAEGLRAVTNQQAEFNA